MVFAIVTGGHFDVGIVFGLLGTFLAGILNLVFRRAYWRWDQFGIALLLSPVTILVVVDSRLIVFPDQAEYVFMAPSSASSACEVT